MTDADRIETPAGFVNWSAVDKHDWLWNTLVDTQGRDPSLEPLVLPLQQRPLTELGIVLRKSQLSKALTHPFDVMESRRPKVIHARGAVAMVEFVTDDSSPFTGLLGPPSEGGGAIGLIRMSLVQKPSRKKSHTPAFGLKLLIDGHASADLLAMNHTVGQGRDFDMFSNTMTHDLSETHLELRTAQKVMARLFAKVSDEPRRLTIKHLADRGRDGSAVDGALTPDRLIFRPTGEAKEIFTGHADVDFRRVLAGVAPDTELYSVESVDVPRGKEPPCRVGVLRTTTSFVSSAGGDRLFFRHVQDL